LLSMRPNDVYRLYQLSKNVRELVNESYWKKRLVKEGFLLPKFLVDSKGDVFKSWYLKVTRYPIVGQVFYINLNMFIPNKEIVYSDESNIMLDRKGEIIQYINLKKSTIPERLSLGNAKSISSVPGGKRMLWIDVNNHLNWYTTSTKNNKIIEPGIRFTQILDDAIKAYAVDVDGNLWEWEFNKKIGIILQDIVLIGYMTVKTGNGDGGYHRAVFVTSDGTSYSPSNGGNLLIISKGELRAIYNFTLNNDGVLAIPSFLHLRQFRVIPIDQQSDAQMIFQASILKTKLLQFAR